MRRRIPGLFGRLPGRCARKRHNRSWARWAGIWYAHTLNARSDAHNRPDSPVGRQPRHPAASPVRWRTAERRSVPIPLGGCTGATPWFSGTMMPSESISESTSSKRRRALGASRWRALAPRRVPTRCMSRRSGGCVVGTMPAGLPATL